VVEVGRKGDNQEQFCSVLHLPPYHPDLNAIELMWGLVKDLIAECSGRKIKLCKQRGMASQYMHVKKSEDEYLKLELAIDEMSEQFIVNLETDSDNSFSDAESTIDREMSEVGPLDS
jgi:hypothetical protein